MRLLEKTISYVNDIFSANALGIKHFERTLFWFNTLYPEATEAMLIAAYGHDIERGFREPGKNPENYLDETFLTYHQTKGAELLCEFLQNEGADTETLAMVKYLVEKHEIGGDDLQNILRDADSMSFLETNANNFVDKKYTEGYTKIKEKIDRMYHRIGNNELKQQGKTLYENLIERLRKNCNMLQQHLTFPAGNETLAALIYKQHENDLPTALFLHGGSVSLKDRIKYFANYFVEKGMPLIAIDFSGHGESTGKLNESSLRKRINEAHAAMEFMDPEKKLTIIGSSMGGHIALEMLKTGRVENLVLFCPAVYSDESIPLQFDQGFTEAIRKENSRESSSMFDELGKFIGRLFIIIGTEDTVIPHGVLTKLIASATNVKQKELIFIPGASHAIHSWLETHPEDFAHVRSKIFAYLDH